MNHNEIITKKQSLRKLLNEKPAYFKYLYKRTIDDGVLLKDFDNCYNAVKSNKLDYFYNQMKESNNFKQKLNILLENAMPEVKVELINALHNQNIYILLDCNIMDAVSKLSSEQKYQLLQLKNQAEEFVINKLPEKILIMVLDGLQIYHQEKIIKLLKRTPEQQLELLKVLKERQSIREKLLYKKSNRSL